MQGIIGVATDDLLHGGTEEHWGRMHQIQKKYKLGKFSHGDGRFAGKEVKYDGQIIKLCQPLYTSEKVKAISITRERKTEKMSYCTPEEVTQLRGLLGSLAWLAKETRPDLAGRIALLQQCMPRPFVQDMLDANAVAREAISEPELGIQFYPIPPEHLRIGTVTDASWGNARQGDLEQGTVDFWEERKDCWIRHHRQPRTMMFHPGGASGGPDLLDISSHRSTYNGETRTEDDWNSPTTLRAWGEDLWTGFTVFTKSQRDHKKVNEKFIQRMKVGSQAGYLVFFYDRRMETEDDGHHMSLVDWKSFRVKRNTVNTLSAECQAMVS